MTNYCKCGCKIEISDDKTWAHGHHRRGVKTSDETCKKMSESQMGEKNHMFGEKHSDKSIKKMVDAGTKRWANPLEREKASERTTKRYEDPLERKKTSEKTTKRYEDPLEREKNRQSMLKNFKNPDFKERHHMWYNDADPDDGVVMLSPYSHRIGIHS